jgi:capsular exopolysaccharide synthesis family protein
MSRYYELMQQMEREQPLPANPTIESRLSVPRESANRSPLRQVTSDLTLGLVQRIFLEPLEQTQQFPRVVVFAGIDHGSGCSQIAASVAHTLAANAPAAVCLVEANFRSPALSRMLGTTNNHGLTDALVEQDSIHSFTKRVRNQSLWLLSSGPIAADSQKLLTSDRMRARFAELRNEFDFVIVDAPPMTRYADAIALGKLCDGVVVVLEAGSTHRNAARNAVQTLGSSRVQILGAVLNKRTFPIPESIYSRI